MRKRFLVGGLVAAVAVACGSTPNGTLSITTGGESDALTRAPAPTQLVVDAVDADGGVTNLATANLPTSNVDLGVRDQSTIADIRVQAKDSSGKVLLTGTTLPIELGALQDTTVPVFIQRTGEFARMPATVGDARESPVTELVIGRYLLVSGGGTGSDPSSQIYDTASLSAFTAPPSMPRVPASIAAVGTDLLVIDTNGATWLELSDNTTGDAAAPSGGTYAEIAGGKTVEDGTGVSYVVGATRTKGDATPRVLRIDTDGTLTFLALTEPRLGAAATWVAGRGLVVVGGSSQGAGAEILPPGATASPTALAYPADATTGQGVAALDGSHVVVAGGADPAGNPVAPHVLDLGCSGTCTPQTWANGPPMALTPSQVVALGFGGAPNDALLVGDDSSGASHAFRITSSGSTELTFKIPRRGARIVPLAIPAVAIVGGANVVESFVP